MLQDQVSLRDQELAICARNKVPWGCLSSMAESEMFSSAAVSYLIDAICYWRELSNIVLVPYREVKPFPCLPCAFCNCSEHENAASVPGDAMEDWATEFESQPLHHLKLTP
ncbi:hypothetical protein Patl1_27214 [Pistacia atlantica]|uniref:Uncharacterized protein n=1 Tax=Pistacia atlantica TaxID=434234 RepID=A0ACC1BEI3_9ROSI|nr:hypothetical protein Patl1_27214 [Pistacia atlantica]